MKTSGLTADLSQAEMDRLDEFLLDRVDDEDPRGRDEGVLGLSELDGFLTAVVSGPSMIPPSAWMPAIWGDYEPVWKSTQEAEEIFQLMMRLMNGIAVCLMEAPEQFEPMFYERQVGDSVVTVVDEWCDGYVRGVALDPEGWDAGGKDVLSLLSPILAFTGASDWSGHDCESSERKLLHERIVANVQAIHGFWLARRSAEARKAAPPIRRSGPRVGRNDPCPCGSGKKYKKCCLS
jgi:uncharacterized protein